MKITHMMVVSMLTLAAIALGGCRGGVKVTFINSSPEPVVVTYTTVALDDDEHEFKAEYKAGDLAAGEKKSLRLHYDEQLLDGEPQLNVTVDGATLKTKTAIITIRRKPYTPKKLTVDITADPDLGYAITVTDENGKVVETK